MPGIDSYSLSNSRLDGTSGILYATGVATSSTESGMTFERGGGTTFTAPYLTMGNLSFRPNRIIIRYSNSPTGGEGLSMTVYNYDTRGSAPASGATTNYNLGVYGVAQGSTTIIVRVYENTGSGIAGGAYVNDNGFRLPVYSVNTSFTWEAYLIE